MKDTMTTTKPENEVTDTSIQNNRLAILNLELAIQSLEVNVKAFAVTQNHLDRSANRDFAGTLRLNAMSLERRLKQLSDGLKAMYSL